MTFRYSARAMGPNHLRLLKPVLSANEDVLEFEIVELPRGDAPPYTAVSYTWGDGAPSEVIYVNGKTFRVSVALWSCLYYLRPYVNPATWTHIWVDAICINQDSDAEKSAQVRLMDETYQQAACVSVWLGLVPGVEKWTHMTVEPIRTYDADPFDWVDYMSELANRPYWSRFWVIQEFLLGGNVEIHCSANQIDWFEFKELLKNETNTNLVGNPDDLGAYFGAGTATTVSCAARPLVEARHPDRHPEFFSSLYELLMEHHLSKAKDPRDRVFALLGLISHDERILLQRLLPNYSLSAEHVAIIALAHVVDIDRESVTADSDSLFLGLGIECKASRGRLIKRAKEFDYLGCDGLGDFLAQMEADSDERYRTGGDWGAGASLLRSSAAWDMMVTPLAAINSDERYRMDRDREAEEDPMRFLLADIDENYRTDRNWEAEEDPSSRSSTSRRMMIISLAAIFGLGIWMYRQR